MTNYDVISTQKGLVKAWVKGVDVDEKALEQVTNVAELPFIYKHVAIMPDVHWGMGATVGSVIPTYRAIVPAAVGVDIGCGMSAVKTSLSASHLPDSLSALRSRIEKSIPHGRTDNGGKNDRGSWHSPPNIVNDVAVGLLEHPSYTKLIEKHPKIKHPRTAEQLCTLGTGNHFIEICLDKEDNVWVMLHSGSRGIGNRIGTYFISKAKEACERWHVELPDNNLAYLPEGEELFVDYMTGVGWAQHYAKLNRDLMVMRTLGALKQEGLEFTVDEQVISCHHNYVVKENHFGKNVWITRKGAVRARVGDLCIIPGAMGAKSYIVEGKGNADSFNSCSHGAGRLMSRTQAKKTFTIEDHEKSTEGLECRKDEGVIDETPRAYKPIDQVMLAQSDLVEIKHELRAVVCVKG